VRVVWNDALSLCKKSEKLPKNGELQKVCITEAKKASERNWLEEVSAVPLQQSIRDLGVAFKNYFDSKTGKRKGPKIGAPQFKKKLHKQTARFTVSGFSLKGRRVYLAKIGELEVVWSRPLPSEPSSVTIIKEQAGRYFLSFVVESEAEIKPARSESIGIDLGLKTFAALSSGEKIESPDYSKLERKIRRAQRTLSRRGKNSKRRAAARLVVAKLHARQRDLRKDFLHKLSTTVVIENQVIALENLNVVGMIKNRRLSKSIGHAGWSEFRSMCSSKAMKFGRDLVIIDRWQPTSQVCSICNFKWGKLDLSVRTVSCISCGAINCRDINAAKNIESIGVGRIHDVKWAGRECKTPLGAVLDELSTQLEVDRSSVAC
jgi:putative transposase